MKKKVNKPLVSIIMPVYNAGDFLREAIESILNQTYKNFELIIIDDASTDDSWNIISSYKKRFPKKVRAFRLVKNLNKGGDVAGNIGFSLARGEFIARMDADDIALPQKLEKQVAFLLNNPKISVLGSSAYVIDKDGKVLGEKIVPFSNEKIYREYFVFHPMIHPTMIIRKGAIKTKKLYKINYSANNDYLTFFEMISKGVKFANLKEKLLCYRVHGKNDSLVNPKIKFKNSLRIRSRAILEFGYRPTLFSLIKLLVQSFVVFILPEKLIVPLYMVARGIAKPTDYVSFHLPKPFVKLRKALLPA